MQPVFIIHAAAGNHDYTRIIAELKPTQNDLDAKGSGRDIQDGLMYRNRIARKRKWSVTFRRLDEDVMKMVEEDMDATYVDITMLDPKTNTYVRRTYYCSTINNGVQRYIGGHTVYDGVTFNITER